MKNPFSQDPFLGGTRQKGGQGLEKTSSDTASWGIPGKLSWKMIKIDKTHFAVFQRKRSKYIKKYVKVHQNGCLL